MKKSNGTKAYIQYWSQICNDERNFWFPSVLNIKGSWTANKIENMPMSKSCIINITSTYLTFMG